MFYIEMKNEKLIKINTIIYIFLLKNNIKNIIYTSIYNQKIINIILFKKKFFYLKMLKVFFFFFKS